MAALSSVLLVVALAVLANIWYQKYVSTGPPFAATLKPTYDYIVVGAGSTGAVIANRLSENPDVTVLLLEAGGSSLGRTEIDVPGAVSHTFHSDADWEYYTEQQDGVLTGFKDKRSYWPRGKAAGGTSCINAMQFVRGSRHDYDRWSEYTGDKGWSYKHVLPYFKRYENVQNPDLRASEYRGDSGPLKVYRVEPMPLAEKIIEGFKSLGYPHNTDYNGKTTAGIADTQVNSNKGERWTTAKAFLYPAMERPNLDVSLHSHVTKVVIKNKKAVGVEVIKNGRKYTVAATKEVILSAGAIGSPQILMLSGVGPKKHLESLKIPVVADLPVGENLQDHLMLDMVVKIREPLSFSLASAGSLWNFLRLKVLGTGPLEVPFFLRTQAFLATTKETKEKDWPDIQVQILSMVLGEPIMDAINFSEETKATLSDRNKQEYGITFLPGLCRPESRGSIQLNSSDPFDHPIMRPNYLDKQEDIETIIRGINEIKKLLDTQPMKDIGAEFMEAYAVPPCNKHRYDSHEYWVCVIKHRPITIYHQSGTCKMGSVSDPTSVVDPQLRVKGISGLRVADASIMPYVTSHNTQAPCLMIGEKAADMILGKPPLAPIDV